MSLEETDPNRSNNIKFDPMKDIKPILPSHGSNFFDFRTTIHDERKDLKKETEYPVYNAKSASNLEIGNSKEQEELPKKLEVSISDECISSHDSLIICEEKENEATVRPLSSGLCDSNVLPKHAKYQKREVKKPKMQMNF